MYDNELPTSRLLVFASESGLNILDSADTWFMDGTHSTAPGQFAQLFCVRVPLGVTHVTAAYGLLPGKQHQHYEEFFTGLLDACLQRDVRPTPIKIVVDYEMAIHNAIRSVISPNIHIQGCFYHLTQSTWHHIQAEGLQARYREDDNIRHFCGMLDGLAFLPVPMVSDGMAYIRETAPEEMVPIIDYFDSNYVSGAYRAVMGNGRMRFRRTPPRFELQMWNVHDATITDCARTNNICESWNNGFRHLVGHSNPSLWSVIECLVKDNAETETEVYRHSTGQQTTKRRKKSGVQHQQRLKQLCQELTGGQKTLEEFLCAVGHCIRLQK